MGKLRKSLIALSALLTLTANISPIAHAATAQTITFAQPAAMTVGQADQTLTATASSALTVALATNNTAICTIVAGKLHAVAVGSCIVTATQAGNVTFAAATAVPRTLAISAARLTAQTITFAPPTSLTLTQAPYTLTATSSSGLVPVITSSTTAVCTVSGLTLTLVTAGTCTLAANQAGNATYAAAPAVSRSITLAKATQTITFAPPTSLTLTQAPYTLTATSSSGLVPVITSSTTTICTVSGLALTLLKTGTCTLAANQAGNASYSAATAVSKSITLAKATQTITLAPSASLTLAQSPYTLTATSSSGLPVTITSSTSSVCTVSGFTLTLVKTGTCTLAANQAGNAVYAAALVVSASTTVIALTPQTISYSPAPSAMWLGQSDQIFTVSASSGLPVSVTVSDSSVCAASLISGTLGVTANAVGTCGITLAQAGDNSFAPAQPVAISIVISSQLPVITSGSTFQPGLTLNSIIPGLQLIPTGGASDYASAQGFEYYQCPAAQYFNLYTGSVLPVGCNPVPIARTFSYTIQPSDAGHSIALAMFAWNPSGMTRFWAQSTSTVLVQDALTSVSYPQLKLSQSPGGYVSLTGSVHTLSGAAISYSTPGGNTKTCQMLNLLSGWTDTLIIYGTGTCTIQASYSARPTGYIPDPTLIAGIISTVNPIAPSVNVSSAVSTAVNLVSMNDATYPSLMKAVATLGTYNYSASYTSPAISGSASYVSGTWMQCPILINFIGYTGPAPLSCQPLINSNNGAPTWDTAASEPSLYDGTRGNLGVFGLLPGYWMYFDSLANLSALVPNTTYYNSLGTLTTVNLNVHNFLTWIPPK